MVGVRRDEGRREIPAALVDELLDRSLDDATTELVRRRRDDLERAIDRWSTLEREPAELRLWQLAHVWFEGDGTSRVATELSRLTTPDEVDAYARAAGLEPEARWGTWAATPHTGGDPTFVSVFRR